METLAEVDRSSPPVRVTVFTWSTTRRAGAFATASGERAPRADRRALSFALVYRYFGCRRRTFRRRRSLQLGAPAPSTVKGATRCPARGCAPSEPIRGTRARPRRARLRDPRASPVGRGRLPRARTRHAGAAV